MEKHLWQSSERSLRHIAGILVYCGLVCLVTAGMRCTAADVPQNAAVATLTGTVQFPAQPGANTTVSIAPYGPTYVHQPVDTQVVGDDHRFSLRVPSTGAYYLTFTQQTGSHFGPFKATEIIVLKPGANHRDFSYTSAVSGRVVDANTCAPLGHAPLRIVRHQTAAESVNLDDPSPCPYFVPEWRKDSERYTHTDADGNFTFDHLAPGEYCLMVKQGPPMPDVGPLSEAFQLKAGEHLTDFHMRVPQVGSAIVSAEDADTGKVLSYIPVHCADTRGILHEACFSMVTAVRPPQPRPAPPDASTECYQRFNELQPGRYTAFMLNYSSTPWLNGTTQDHYIPAMASFDVTAGNTTEVVLKLHKSGSLIFRLGDTADDPKLTELTATIQVVNHDTGEPAFSGPYGRYPGEYITVVKSEAARYVTLPPGTYDLTVGLTKISNRPYLFYIPADACSEQYAWVKKLTVTIAKDHDVVMLLSRKDIVLQPVTTPVKSISH